MPTFRSPSRSSSAPRKSSTSGLMLPTKPIAVSDDLFDYNHCIYGRKSIGKSTLGSAFPGSLNFRFERARRNLNIFQVLEDGSLLIWPTFMEYLKLFCDAPEYQFAVIDSVDVCYEKAFEFVCKERGCTHPNQKNDYGATWGAISDTFMSAFDMIQDAGKKFVLLSHEKTRRFENPDGSELERVDLTLAPSAAAIVKQRCEFIYYYGYAGQDRVITIRNDRNQVECACGVGTHFRDPDGTPISRFEIPNDPDKVLDTLVAAWDNKLRDYDYEPPRAPRAAKPTRTTTRVRTAI